MEESGPKLKLGLIYSFNPNEDLENGLPDESFDTEHLDQSSRDFWKARLVTITAPLEPITTAVLENLKTIIKTSRFG